MDEDEMSPSTSDQPDYQGYDLRNECAYERRNVQHHDRGEERAPVQPIDGAAGTALPRADMVNWDDWGREDPTKPVQVLHYPPEGPHPNRFEENIKPVHPSLNYNLARGDVLETCPYYGHQVRRAKFLLHLHKCNIHYRAQMIRNSQLEMYRVCPYNSLHHVPDSNFDEHLQMCGDARKAIEGSLKPENYERKRKESRGHGRYDEDGDVSEACSSRISSQVSSIGIGSSCIFGPNSEIQFRLATLPSPPPEGAIMARRREPDAHDEWQSGREISVLEMQEEPTKIESTAERHVYQIPPGLSKAQRKRFRHQNNLAFMMQRAKNDDGQNEAAQQQNPPLTLTSFEPEKDLLRY